MLVTPWPGIAETCSITTFISPVKWKKYYNLINTQKDSSRTKAIEFFPYISSKLSRKKDANKADAILIASFYYQNQKN